MKPYDASCKSSPLNSHSKKHFKYQAVSNDIPDSSKSLTLFESQWPL